MQTQLALPLLLALVLATIQSGDCLRCWTCSSDVNGECGDFFNTTKYSRPSFQNIGASVQLTNCDPINLSDAKYACMKQLSSYGSTKVVRRKCEQLPYSSSNTRETACPPNSQSEFCEMCYTDGCNGATTIRTSALISTLIPIIYYLTK